MKNYDKRALMENSKFINENDIEYIDKEMIPILIELNSKGYITLYCCQGHCENKKENQREQTYIMFSGIYNFDIEPPTYNREKNSRYTKIRKDRYTITIEHFTSLHSSIEQKEQERQEYMKKLYDWACNLKDLTQG